MPESPPVTSALRPSSLPVPRYDRISSCGWSCIWLSWPGRGCCSGGCCCSSSPMRWSPVALVTYGGGYTPQRTPQSPPKETPMTLERAQLGNNGPDITRLGLGAWAIGGGEWDFGWRPPDDQDPVDTSKKSAEW